MSKLKRYTQLPQLLHMLRTRSITLLSPGTWDDRNDTYFITRYKERSRLKSVLVLCMTKASDTYHHWHVFAGNTAGVQIQFHDLVFRDWALHIKGSKLKEVEYLKLDEVRQGDLFLDQLPFVKRWAYRHEGEVRLAWISTAQG